jgi:hypothetical protein
LASGQVGTLSRGATLLALTGVSALGEIQSLGVARDITVSGNVSAGTVGNVSNTNTAGLSGVTGQGLVSQVIVPLNSQAAIGEVGSVGSALTIALTGVGARGIAGSASLDPRTLRLSGVRAVGAVGSTIAVYWKPIDDTQNPNWQNVDNSQASNWQAVQT